MTGGKLVCTPEKNEHVARVNVQALHQPSYEGGRGRCNLPEGTVHPPQFRGRLDCSPLRQPQPMVRI